jgi:large subunit ribosomal protein L6
MSRIGNKAVPVSDKVKVDIQDKTVKVSGPNADMEHVLPELISAEMADSEIVVKRANDSAEAKAMHGLSRSLIANMVTGVTEGFKKELEIQGVGYRAQVSGKKLVLNVGYSHPIEFEFPEDVKISVAENTKVTIEGADKQLVGQVAATVRGFRKPEPYKGKGIRYVDEHIRRKEGKTV